ncbi:MAG: type II secretion system secretin GspD [Syntrophales bacterium]|nr:type II secretion system secretin GspD [Syntrophales bacterium]
MPSLSIIEERIAVARGRESAGESLEGLRKRGKSSSLLRPLSALLRQTRRTLRGGNAVVNKSRYSVLVAAFVIFAALFVLLPGVSGAARIAGEEQPVTTAPAPSAIAPQKTAAEKNAAEKVTKTVAPAKTVEAVKPAEGNVQAPRTPAHAIPAPVQSQERGPRFGAGPSLGVQQPASGATASPVNQPAAAGQASPAAQQNAAASTAVSPAAAGSGRYVTIDFDNVDITVFIKFVSELTGRNFVVDEKVKGKVTVISPKKIAVAEVYKVFESVLDIYGFATVEAGEVIKIIPALDARGKNLELRLKRESIAPEDKIVTQILSLQHATPDDMKKVLDPLISKTSVVLSYPPAGMLIITDVLSNIKRLQDIVTALDVEGVGELISYIPLKYASATEMAKSLAMVFQKQVGPGRVNISPVRVVADDRTNALIILAAENDMARIRELLDLMDKEVPRGSGTIRVYYLQNAKAEDLVKVLTGLPQQAKPTGAAGAAAAASSSGAVFSKNVQIMADKSTNSLIVTADPADYLIIEDVIQKLDITRPMVYLEGLIMEVNAEKGFKLGVEWQGANAVSYDGKTGAIIGGVSGDKGSYGIAQGLIANKGLPSGLSFGVIGQMITVATIGAVPITFPNLGAFIQAYQSDSDFRILSTPQLLVLDNEDAEITVGENVPYVSRQDSGVVGVTGTTNYSSYEYKDVGVTLKVTPQINKDGFVRMKLDQTVTKVVSQSASVDSAGSQVLTPTTLKRTAKTTIVVKSGETVVIGGMIQDDSESGTYKVPLLGDIPLLGWLFKSKSTSAKRTNLFVFITPRIIEQPEDARKIKDEKMDYMKTIQEGTIRTMPQKKTEAREKQ